MAPFTFSGPRLASGVATLLLIGGGLSLASPDPAFATNCSASWTDRHAGSGYPTKNPTNLRTGPGSDCGLKLTLGKDVHLHYDCFRYNAAEDAYWEHVHLAGSPGFDNGWVRTSNLSGVTGEDGTAC